MGELTNWAKENSPFLKIGDNETERCIFKGYTVVPDNRDPKKTKVRYELMVNGEKKWFESASGSVAMAFDKVGIGDAVDITRTVKGGQARYSVVTEADEENEAEEIPGEAYAE